MATSTRLNLNRRATPQQNLEAAIDAFYRRCYAKNLSEHTVRYYRTRFEAFVAYLKEQELVLTPAEITPSIIRDFLAHEAQRVSPLTASHGYTTLRAFFRFLVQDDYLDANPIEKVAKVRQRKKVVETFSVEQIEAMLATARNNFSGARLRAILLMLVDCGLRVSELCGLTLDDIRWEEQSVIVLGKGNKERVVPFGNVTMRALQGYLSRRGDVEGVNTLFVTCYGDALGRFRVQKLVKECGELAKITGVRCSPHTFRHTFAVMFLRNGGDVFSLQKLLGHADLTMTRRYAELSETDVLEKHRLYSPGDRFFSAAKQNVGRTRLR